MKRFYCNGKNGYCDRGNDANVTCFNCEFGNGEGGKEVEVPDTNYDRIRNMSIEKMAEFICGIFDENKTLTGYFKDKVINGIIIPDYDVDRIKEWLESEVTEE